MQTRSSIILDYARPEKASGRSVRGVVVRVANMSMLILLLAAVIAAVMVPKFVGHPANAKASAAAADLETLRTQLEAFKADNQRYPTTAEGLMALVEKPDATLPNWNRSYIDKLPMDPWGHPYIYRANGAKGFVLLSGGPDGQEGGGDDIQ